tara:strand:+ start:3798 stop:4679 length:882 start_codon:yes stop_codon:yes gene_type:complete
MCKTGLVAVVGVPNVGKSTLINSLLGEKVAIVSEKAQTTREAQIGILTLGENQMLLIDTPGITKPRHLLDKKIMSDAMSRISESDVVLWIVDVSKSPREKDRQAIELILKSNYTNKVVIAMNKMDLLNPKYVVSNTDLYRDLCPSAKWMLVSGLKQLNLDKLVEQILGLLPVGNKFYNDDEITDTSTRKMASELMREAALKYLRDEIPHGVAVIVEAFDEKDDYVNIEAVLIVENDRHKSIVIGKNGNMIKRIGITARLNIEEMMDKRVSLDTHVKVQYDWRNNPGKLQYVGY